MFHCICISSLLCSCHSLRTQKPNEGVSMTLIIIVLIVLFLACYVRDSSQAQKNRFRMQQRGTYVARNAFPQVP